MADLVKELRVTEANLRWLLELSTSSDERHRLRNLLAVVVTYGREVAEVDAAKDPELAHDVEQALRVARAALTTPALAA